MRLIGVVLGSLMIVHAVAQERFQATVDRNVWLQGDNAAALTLCEDSTISMANVGWGRTWGQWRNVSEGSRENNVNAEVASYLRLSSRVMTQGCVRYDNFTGEDMQGSMLYDDGSLKPFDIVEDTISYPGEKHYEMLGLNGAIGWRTMHHLSLGAKIDYITGYYVKYKDLRHTNTYMNLDAIASICLPQLMGGLFDIGFYGEYRRRSESVLFKTYGTSDVIYKSFVDYAALYGVVETYGGEGFTDSGKDLPHLSEKMGGSFQLSIHPTDNIEWYNELSWLNHKGNYGKESQYTISYAKWEGAEMTMKSHLKWMQSGNIHIFDFTLNREELTASRKIYQRNISQGNIVATYYQYYTPVKMNDKLRTNISVAYSGYLTPVNGLYKWDVSAGLKVEKLDQTAYVYPHYRRQDITIYNPYASVLRRVFVNDDNYLSVQIGVETKKGNGDKIQEGTLSNVRSENNIMAMQNRYFLQNYEYQTKQQWNYRVKVGYSWGVQKMPMVQPSVSISYDLHTAKHSQYIGGKSRQMVMLGVGCGF